MLYKAILSLALFGSAFAAPTVKRDLATIQTSIMTVGTSLTQLDTAIKAIQGPADAMKVLTASTMVNQALTDATTKIMATQPITLTDALSLQTSAQTLTTTATTTVTDLMAKKAVIVMAGQQQATLAGLQQQKTASDALAKAVSSKVPAGVQNIAMQQTMQIGTSLDAAIKAFS